MNDFSFNIFFSIRSFSLFTFFAFNYVAHEKFESEQANKRASEFEAEAEAERTELENQAEKVHD